MAEINVFREATKKKMRFPFLKGMINAEDLWDLTPDQLNAIYTKLKSEKKEDEGLLPSANTDYNAEIDTKMAVVRDIFDYKMQLRREAEYSEVKRQQKQKIQEILKEREDGALKEKSTEELEEMLKGL